jgi:sirohydrochlorin ferrochelatase
VVEPVGLSTLGERHILLVDNGSLRAESVLNLRRLAQSLSDRIGLRVHPASLLHSSKVPAEALEGEPAVNMERRMRLLLEAGRAGDGFCLLPFFFAPSAALTEYAAERVAFRREKHGPFAVDLGPFLWDGGGDNTFLIQILRERVESVLQEQHLQRPRVALIDHGSPKREVTAVRNALARELGHALGERVEEVRPCSMERREGPEYAFNEPLLENLLDEPGWSAGDIVVAMQFLSPGRHAGPGGDVARICKAASARHAGLRCHMTDLVGTHPFILDLLELRLRTATWQPL